MREAAADAPLEPVLDWSTLTPGRRFPAVPIPLDDASVEAYLAATGEHHPLLLEQGWVPPCYATLVRFAKASLGGRWPSGTLQMDHQIAMRRPIRRGERLQLALAIGAVEPDPQRPIFEMLATLSTPEGEVVGTQSARSLWGGSPATVARTDTASAAASETAAATTSAPDPKILPASSSPPATASAAAGAVPVLSASFPMASLRAYGEIAAARDPIHLDPEFARHSRHGVNIAQGRLVMTLISRAMLQTVGEPWLQQGGFALRFRRPVLVGETISAFLGEQPGGGWEAWCENPRGERVIEGRAWLGEASTAG